MDSKEIIFTPGPQKAVGLLNKEDSVFHRSHEMDQLFKGLTGKMCEYFGVKYANLYPIPGTDTIDLFTRSVNYQKGRVAAVINTGYWAHNIVNVLEGNEIKVEMHEQNIFDLDVNSLIELFKKDKAQIYYAIASETSTGEYFNYKNIYQALKKLDKFLFMDAISLPVYFFTNNPNYNFNADFTIYSSAKTFHGLPGFNFILTNIDVATSKLFANKGYANLKLYSDFAKKGQFPNTINTLLFKDFKNSFEYTVNNTEKIKTIINGFKDSLTKSVGSEIIYLNKKHHEVSNMVVLKFPPFMDANNFTKDLDKKKIYIGRDLMDQNTVRICFNSYNTQAEVDVLIKEIKAYQKACQK